MLGSHLRRLPAPFVLLGALACAPGAESPSSSADATPVARIAGETITADQLDGWIKDQLFRQASRDGDVAKLHELRSRALEDMIRERLLERAAAKRGVERDALLRQEIERRSAVTPEEVQEYYEAHQESFEGVEREEALARVERSLVGSRQRSAFDAFMQELREEAGVSVALEQPRIQVAAEGPSLGPDDAPVTIVEFSDYECPYCRRAEPIVKQVLERYPEDVRLVYRHFPLTSIHPRAQEAAEAAACAEEQDRFWDYHEKVFENTQALSKEDLLRYGSELGLDTQAFASCVEENRTQARVEKDLEAGRGAGVSGTPMFFVNGIPMSGARPVEDFVRVIEEELGRKTEAAAQPEAS